MRAVALGVSIAIAAQQPPPQTFRSSVQIVQVDVRVFKDGRFVTDLGPSEFQIVEDGVPQQIHSVVLIGAPATPAPDSTRSTAPVAPAAPSGPVAPPSSPPAVWIFVFDAAHLSPGGLQRTREAVVQFISRGFHQGDIGGVVIDGKMANNRLTGDPGELRAAAASAKLPGDLRSRQIELTRNWPRFQDELEAIRIGVDGDPETLRIVSGRACTDDPDQCRKVPVDLLVQEKARRLSTDIRRATMKTLAAVQALANGLARIDGPKTVVFLSEGFILDDGQTQLRQAEGMANRAGARFYTIDARGLDKGAARSDLIDQQYAANPSGAQPTFDLQADGTTGLAVGTGGLAIRNANDVGRALDEIQRDAATYYIVGYTPSNGTFDGKYRSISVKVTRPGVRVRARRGYVALEPAILLGPASGPTSITPPDLPVSSGVATLPGVLVPAGDPSAAAARTRVDAGRLVQQLKDFGEASPPMPTTAEAGWSAYERGDIDGAARELGEASKALEVRPWVLYALGFAELAQKRYSDAAHAWERVRRNAPEFEPVYFNLADAYLMQRDEGAAIRVLRDAEQRWPADSEVANAIGVLQVRRGALDAAIASFVRATGIAPADSLGYFNLGRAHQMRAQKLQRYDRQAERWIGGEEDRRRAVAAFQKYLDLGGPFERQAREALDALSWSSTPGALAGIVGAPRSRVKGTLGRTPGSPFVSRR